VALAVMGTVTTRRELYPLQFADRRLDVFERHGVAVARKGRHHRRVAQGVDEARRAARVAEDGVEAAFLKDQPALRARDLETVLHVSARVGLRERREVEAQADALRELQQLRRVELLVELGLPGENDAQHLFLGGLDAREQAHFFEHPVAQVLRLVDDQQHLAIVGVLLDQEGIERAQHFRLLHLERREAELHQHRLQELDGRELRLVDLRNHHVLLELPQECLDQRGLAGTDLSRNDDEAIREPDGRFHVRLGACMVLAQVKEGGIRTEAERQILEFEQFEVHPIAPLGTPVGNSVRESRKQQKSGRAVRPQQPSQARVAARRRGFEDRAMADLPAGSRFLAIIMKVQITLGEPSFPRRQFPHEIDHRSVPQGLRAAQGPAENGAQMVFELARDSTLDGPVAGVVHARCHLVGQQVSAQHEEFHREDADVIEMLQQATHVPLRLGLQPAIGPRRHRMTQDPVAVCVGAKRVEGHRPGN
jgi:hypothetical protein